MTQDEFDRIVALLEAHWPGDELPAETVALLEHELAGFDGDAVLASVLSLAREGRSRMPTAGMIRRRVFELKVDAPPWGTAVRLLMDARRRHAEWKPPEDCPLGKCDGSGWLVEDSTYEFGSGTIDGSEARRCECAERVREASMRAAGLSPVLRDFVSAVGWSEIDELALGGRTAEAQVRTKYDQFVEALLREAGLLGLNAPGLPAVERVRRESPGLLSLRGDVVKALDPASS